MRWGGWRVGIGSLLVGCVGDPRPPPAVDGTESSTIGETSDDIDSSAGTGPADPVCGNGVMEADELCDDGNEDDGDGCSADCRQASCLVPVTHPTVQAGVDDQSCPIVWVLAGTYPETVTIARAVELRGTGSGEVTIDGGGLGSTVVVDQGSVVIGQLRITGGRAVDGGGIYNSGSLTLEGTTVAGNEAVGTLRARGGGIFNDGGIATLEGAAITDNLVTITEQGGTAAGGGIYTRASQLSASGSTVISGNRVTTDPVDEIAAFGGGLYVEGTTVTLSGDTEVVGNRVEATAAMVSMFTVTRARGGGIYLDGGELSMIEGGTVADNEVELLVMDTVGVDPVVAEGGGIFMSSSRAELVGVEIRGNTTSSQGTRDHAARGGGLGVEGQSTVMLTEVSFTRNLASALSLASAEAFTEALAGGGALFGEGIETSDASIHVVDCYFGDNQSLASSRAALVDAVAMGGAVLVGAGGYSEASTALLVERSTVAGNLAHGLTEALGGGLHGVGGSNQAVLQIDLVNSTFSNNEARTDRGGAVGGGIALEATSSEDSSFAASLSSLTVTLNEADSTGGLWIDGSMITALLRNSIVQGNFATTGFDLGCSTPGFTSGGYNLTGPAPPECMLSMEDQVGMLAGLLPLDDNGGPTPTHALPRGSVAIDEGDPAGCMMDARTLLVTDQRGEARPSGIRCDIGAFEYQH